MSRRFTDTAITQALATDKIPAETALGVFGYHTPATLSGTYNVMHWGANNQGTTSFDNGAIVQAIVDDMDADKGGVILFPPGRYNFDTGVDLNAFTGSKAQVQVVAYGAELFTNDVISIFYANVTDNTQANLRIGRKFIFNGGSFVGSNASGQKGIEIDASYNASFCRTNFNRSMLA